MRNRPPMVELRGKCWSCRTQLPAHEKNRMFCAKCGEQIQARRWAKPRAVFFQEPARYPEPD